MINSIPGVNIEARFGGMPEVPGMDVATNATDKATAGQKIQQSINAADTATAAQKAQQTINAAIPSISPTRPTAVPPGGLLTSIQNNSNSQNKGVHVENMTIQNSKPMNPLEMENMMAMAVGG